MDAETIGRRIAEARARAGLTQAQLAAEIGIDRSALTKIEIGDRRVTALELARLANAVGVRIEWFVQDAPEAIVSHRNLQEPGAPSARIDGEVERVARAVEFVAEHDQRFAVPTTPGMTPPTTVDGVEAMAARARALLGADKTGPLAHLDDKVASLGLLAFSVDLGIDSADAATVLLRQGGVSVINGYLRVGRRRIALAHEFAHYLVADEYTVDWRTAEHDDSARWESLCDRFARALLLPAAALPDLWQRYTGNVEGDRRTAAVRIASEYRVDMSTLSRRLAELRILGPGEADRIRSIRTTRSDIVELDLVVGEELNPPALPRDYQRAVLRLYRAETVSAERALDLLFDTFDDGDLPPLPERSENEIWEYL